MTLSQRETVATALILALTEAVGLYYYDTILVKRSHEAHRLPGHVNSAKITPQLAGSTRKKCIPRVMMGRRFIRTAFALKNIGKNGSGFIRDTIRRMRLFRLCAPLLLIAIASAQLLIVSPAEITCDSAAHAVSTSGIARWIQFVAPAANSAVVRIGDSNTGASRGIPIAAGGGYMMPVGSASLGYDLTKVYYYCTTADKVSISWAK